LLSEPREEAQALSSRQALQEEERVSPPQAWKAAEGSSPEVSALRRGLGEVQPSERPRQASPDESEAQLAEAGQVQTKLEEAPRQEAPRQEATEGPRAALK
jgi:hypothetical protein